ncbi:Zinc finger, C3HC4 type (RING finger) [Musa troglodytarum]|uniref:Zinc finger, C3HC4 type (RING finger) n=1 Tax=Musa troglodytarum TaxID=320322 RepID=A0A9E7EH19_9LILI|nr:Zinc finger, C3HC4 type (RING finger) [Musa troglodytarum]
MAAVMFLLLAIVRYCDTRQWGSVVVSFLDKIPHGIYVVPSSPSLLPSTSDDIPEHQLDHCVICMEEYAGGERLWVMPACKHVFHEACIEQWLLKPALTCPICRGRVIHAEAATAGSDGDDDNNIETPFLFVAAVIVIVMSICDCYDTRQWRSKVASLLNKIPHGIYVVPSSPSRLPSTSDDVPEHQLHHCVICMEEYAGGEQLWVMPACKHVFHEACIKQWLLKPAFTCPICRDRVIESSDDDNDDNDNDNNIETPLLVGTY